MLKLYVIMKQIRFLISTVTASLVMLGLLSISASSTALHARDIGKSLEEALSTLDKSKIRTGLLYDRVLPISNIKEYNGSVFSKAATLDDWKQIYFEMYRSSINVPAWSNLKDLLNRAEESTVNGVIPIAVTNLKYNRIRSDAVKDGSLVLKDGHAAIGKGDPFEEGRVFSFSPLKDYTYLGADVVFELSKKWFVTNDTVPVVKKEVDFADGLGFRPWEFRSSFPVHYKNTGPKTIRVRFINADGTTLHASSYFHVQALETPNPNDTIFVTAAIPYRGEYGSGEAYVYLSENHTSLTNPVIVIEGFDLDNSMNWDEIYNLLNQENLVETLRSQGFDTVVLNFTDATDYIQRNAYVIIELIEEVQASINPLNDVALIGASMGGLASRYALTYMEAHGLPYRVRTFISFDGPQKGANIPLGIQYWMDFFKDQSEDAAYLLSRLDTPAARQMLVYHHTNPPSSIAEPDSLRNEFLADIAAIGSYPTETRLVAVANGSGSQADQGFSAGDQIILYEYNSFLVDIIGNVWAVPDGVEHIIFDGLIDIILLPKDQMSVTVSGTLPYDNAPGGWRASMAQMDSSEATYGDIIALHDYHCFVPTISALSLDTDDLFYDVAGDSAILSHTPFDVVYFPSENEEHMTITAESADWFIREIRYAATGVATKPSKLTEAVALYQNYPNPFNPVTTIGFYIPEPMHVSLRIYDPQGKLVTTLVSSSLSQGYKKVMWNGKNAEGRAVGSGVYFYRLNTDLYTRTRKMLLVK